MGAVLEGTRRGRVHRVELRSDRQFDHRVSATRQIRHALLPLQMHQLWHLCHLDSSRSNHSLWSGHFNTEWTLNGLRTHAEPGTVFVPVCLAFIDQAHELYCT